MQQDNRPENSYSRPPPPTPPRAGECLRKEISKDLPQPLELSPTRQLFFHHFLRSQKTLQNQRKLYLRTEN